MYRSLVLCWSLFSVLHSVTSLRCYSCRGGKHCGISFSTSPTDSRIVSGNELYDTCSIRLGANGETFRAVMPLGTCRSSARQFCCNDDLCNGLPAPPLPAFTQLSCAWSHCPIADSECEKSNFTLVYRSSAIASCTRIDGRSVHKSYQSSCSSNRSLLPPLNAQVSCCYSPLCNQRAIQSVEAKHCYTCDSRLTGLSGCSVLDTRSSSVFRSTTWNPSESCAVIVGLAGTDLITGASYPAFIVRTFVGQCVDQPVGKVNYGGATFDGQLKCCSSSLCNAEPVSRLTTAADLASVFHLGRMLVFIAVVCLGLLFIIMGISVLIYRRRWKKTNHSPVPDVVSDGATVLFIPLQR